jgi:hypothetical protein
LSKLAFLQIVPILAGVAILLDKLKSKTLIIGIIIADCVGIIKSLAFAGYFLYSTFILESSENLSISIFSLSPEFVVWIILIMSLLEIGYIYFTINCLENSRRLLIITERPISLSKAGDEDDRLNSESDVE